MTLLTKELREKLLANGREQAKVKGTKAERDFPPVVKFFYPAWRGHLAHKLGRSRRSRPFARTLRFGSWLPRTR